MDHLLLTTLHWIMQMIQVKKLQKDVTYFMYILILSSVRSHDLLTFSILILHPPHNSNE